MSACNLLISDLRLWVHLGYSAEEKYHSQLVSVNIDFTFKSHHLGLTTDRLEDTICYLEVVQSIQSLVQSKQFNLIEHL
ncbi:dihydroneopterin aldolase [Wolbachia endosymbiont of Drosophila bicornuta]|uniref:dihydroneopterin aldolase n=1 Tax=Wolbachia TaxID=953 RepID=UPI00217522F0|nr:MULTISPECIES: dihydroneopterin aldolase [Wolbachia]MDE5056158.1 dihydroneopterin aldolase [Wolbachia endosymbiont of Drosophila bicornuta]